MAVAVERAVRRSLRVGRRNGIHPGVGAAGAGICGGGEGWVGGGGEVGGTRRGKGGVQGGGEVFGIKSGETELLGLKLVVR